MSSNINPNNIDTTYPIAGQDNDSQGFRDNFTNIKTNFQYSQTEITELQDKAILKSALTGSTLSNNMGGAPITNAKLDGSRTTRISLGNASAQTDPGVIPIAYSSGGVHSFTLDDNSSIDFQSWPSAGNGSWIRVVVTVNDITKTLTLPASVSLGLNGIQGLVRNYTGSPPTFTGSTITFGQTGTYAFEFTTSNGGTTIAVQDLNRALSYYTNPLFLAGNESLESGDAVDLTKPTSYFSTSGASTATLAAGTEGQVKVFAMYADSGNMVITVTNPGWSGAGTITFGAVGQACTLQYINNKWFCIGNNGAVFS